VAETNIASLHEPELRHHFDDLGQQHEAATLGMWLFLATEVLFFGGLFAAYMLYRVWYPGTFGDASRTLDITLGTVNTMVLITSSLTMALAVHAASTDERRATMVFLVLTMALGAVFLGIKGVEYYRSSPSTTSRGRASTSRGRRPSARSCSSRCTSR
jgi:cytochrome c oxidase subunit III